MDFARRLDQLLDVLCGTSVRHVVATLPPNHLYHCVSSSAAWRGHQELNAHAETDPPTDSLAGGAVLAVSALQYVLSTGFPTPLLHRHHLRALLPHSAVPLPQRGRKRGLCRPRSGPHDDCHPDSPLLAVHPGFAPTFGSRLVAPLAARDFFSTFERLFVSDGTVANGKGHDGPWGKGEACWSEATAMGLLSDEFKRAWVKPYPPAATPLLMSVLRSPSTATTAPMSATTPTTTTLSVAPFENNDPSVSHCRRLFPSVTFLGTGSAVPSKYRNVSAALACLPVMPRRGADLSMAASNGTTSSGEGFLSLHDHCRYVFGLLDCGEGTMGQLSALFGGSELLSSPGGDGGEDATTATTTTDVDGVILRHLRFAWISHLHPDHNLGLFSVLSRRSEVLRRHDSSPYRKENESPSPPLTILAPASFCDFATAVLRGRGVFSRGRKETKNTFDAEPGNASDLHAAADCCDRLSSCGEWGRDFVFEAVETFVPSSSSSSSFDAQSGSTTEGGGMLVPPSLSSSPIAASLAAVGWRCVAFTVDHPADAYGIVLETIATTTTSPPASSSSKAIDGSNLTLGTRPWMKVVYSGDTRPCANVIEASRGADLLVHEATFSCELHGEAVAKKHSTVSEALGVARAAGVATLALTHFSQRYPKIPELSSASRQGYPCGDDGSVSAAAVGTRQPTFPRHFVVGFDHLVVPVHCPFDRSWPLATAPLGGADFSSVAVLDALTNAGPALAALMAEYEAWGAGTSKRLRDTQSNPAAAGAGDESPRERPRH